MGQIVKYLTATAVAATLLLPASASTAAAASPARPTASVQHGVLLFRLPYPVRIERTGGFAGVHQTITIARNGDWHYSDPRGGTAASGNLGPWQVWTLRRLLRDPALPGSLGYHPNPGCADAFEYRVVLARWQPVSTYTDCGNPPAALARVVNAVVNFTAF